MEFELITNRRIVDECRAEILNTAQLVVDLGGRNRFNTNLGAYRHKKIAATYFCTDIQFGDCDFISDIHCIPIASGSVDAVICNAVFEHITQPWIAAQEIHRILRPGGVALFYVPFLYPYHAENTGYEGNVGGYDFYRYTIDGIRFLFRDFAKMRLSPVEYGLLAWWRMTVRFRFPRSYPAVLRLQRYLEQRAGRPLGVNQATGFDFWVQK